METRGWLGFADVGTGPLLANSPAMTHGLRRPGWLRWLLLLASLTGILSTLGGGGCLTLGVQARLTVGPNDGFGRAIANALVVYGGIFLLIGIALLISVRKARRR